MQRCRLRPIDEARLRRLGHPDGITVWVIAPVIALRYRRAAEFSPPDDQRVLQEPAPSVSNNPAIGIDFLAFSVCLRRVGHADPRSCACTECTGRRSPRAGARANMPSKSRVAPRPVHTASGRLRPCSTWKMAGALACIRTPARSLMSLQLRILRISACFD